MHLPRTFLESTGMARGLPAIFVHTPKCGGSFIAEGVGRRRDRHCFTRRHPSLRGHLTYLDYKERFPALGLNIDDFMTFSVVRNPWAWHVSVYHYIQQLKGRNKEKAADVHERLTKYSFSDYLAWVDDPKTAEKQEIAAVHNVSDWVIDENGKISVDFLMRQETLEEDFAIFIKKYSLRLAAPKKRVNESVHKNYRTYYSDSDAALVARRHERDIALLGYSFDR